MKDYLISKAPEIEKILHVVETSEDTPAGIKDLMLRPSLATTPPALLQHLGAELRGFLVLCLSGDARCAVDTTDRREGFEVWRKLLKGVYDPEEKFGDMSSSTRCSALEKPRASRTYQWRLIDGRQRAGTILSAEDAGCHLRRKDRPY